MASADDRRSIIPLTQQPANTPTAAPPVLKAAPGPKPFRIQKKALRTKARAAKWTVEDRRWQRSGTKPPADRFQKYQTQAAVPEYDDETYEQHLKNDEWSKQDTDHVVALYRECNGKWPVIMDEYAGSAERTMEDLKSRFYGISATLLQLNTPITSMTAPEYSLFETLQNFNPVQETSRKKLAEAHLYRGRNEVDEESVLLAELQRIMLNQATLDSEREDLRSRLEYPRGSSNGYQYTTSQALTGLWQQLLQADKLKKHPRLRPTGTALDGSNSLPTPMPQSARPSVSNPPPPSASTNLSEADMQRFGVVTQDKLPSGVTFASDKISKPRIAKSTVMTEKIASVLSFAGVMDLIPLPTPAVVNQFEKIMSQVHILLDLRRLKEKEEQELSVRAAEVA